jgi:hypothetical protein
MVEIKYLMHRAVKLPHIFIICLSLLVGGCTQELQNRISRSVQNWTGTNGVLDVMSEGKVMYRFINIDKITTARSTGAGNESRPYRFGYGVFDQNFNYKQDKNEKKVYFEISDYGTNYIFYENPFVIR